MRLNLQIDDALLQEASRLGRQQTPQLLVLEALREYIQRRQALKAPIAALGTRLRQRFAESGGVELGLPPRKPARIAENRV